MAYLWSGSLITQKDGYSFAPALELFVWDGVDGLGYDLWDDDQTFYVGLSVRPVKDKETGD